MSFREKNRILLANIEASPGTPETLDVTNHAVKVENIVMADDFQSEQPNEHTGKLDASKPVPAGGFAGTSFNVLARGPGAGNEGAAPDWGVLMRAAGLAQTLTPAAIADTAQAGVAGSITLHVGASAVDNAYRGMVIRTTGGTGSGQRRAITAYDGTSKVASVTPDWTTPPDITTTFSIDPSALWTPADINLEVATINVIDRNAAGGNAVRHHINSAAIGLSIAAATRGVVRLTFTPRGIKIDDDDIADPGEPTFDPGPNVVYMAADTFLGQDAIKVPGWNYDLNSNVDQSDDPAAENGYDIGEVMDRRATGTIAPPQVNRGTRNPLADFKTGGEFWLWTRWGSVPGNRHSVLARIGYTGGPAQQSVRGKLHDQIPFQVIDGLLFYSAY